MKDKPQVHDDGATMAESASGGFKQAKRAQFSLIPPDVLWELAELYGEGAALYDRHNYLKGYDWSLSYDAAQRHLNLFWMGEEDDEATKSRHLICAMWHCIALAMFSQDREAYGVYDNRLVNDHPLKNEKGGS